MKRSELKQIIKEVIEESKLIKEDMNDREFEPEVMDLYKFYKDNFLDDQSPETQRRNMTDYLWDTYDQDSLFNNELIDTLLNAIEYGEITIKQ